MTSIGVIGAGISGLHLALRLQQAGVPTTVHADRDPAAMAAGPPANLVVRFPHTVRRERDLGVAHWDGRSPVHAVHLDVGGEQPFGFTGRLPEPASGVDFRVYLPTLLADYARRGGQVRVGAVDVADVARRHDLVVVATGARSLAALFPRNAARSPYDAPQRLLCGGMFHGVAAAEPEGVSYQLCPGAGEIFSYPQLTADGPAHSILIEAVPGGPLEPLTDPAHRADPGAFTAALLQALARWAPRQRERIEDRAFAPLRPTDLLWGSVTPVVRRGWAALDGGTYALAVGDAWVLNDPIVGQGANLGSRNAVELAGAVAEGGPYDEGFCRRAETLLWRSAQPVTEWTNAFLAPPPPHAVELLRTAAENRRVADDFVTAFDDPAQMWTLLADPAATSTWLARRRVNGEDEAGFIADLSLEQPTAPTVSQP
jgi:2-polyprenyl-6-methoxyphenol hydroxylase-like FAD-dependent oxidoreductase